jgi:hypothetical protein
MRIFAALLALPVLVGGNLCWADSCPDELLAASQKAQLKGVWVHDASPDKGWMPLDTSRPLTSKVTDEFAYIGRTTIKAVNREGALSVKFLSRNPDRNTPAETVLLRRTSPEAGCGFRQYILWALAHLDFLIGVNVSLEDYIRFHATDSDISGLIKRFHAAYRDAHGECTDSATGDKRSAFLIDHHEPPLKSSEALIAALKRFVEFQSKADAETSTKSSAPPVPGVVKAQLTKFRQYSEAETQVHTYELDGGPVCVRFSDRNRNSAISGTDIEVVDLDAAKGSEFRRRYVRINWR